MIVDDFVMLGRTVPEPNSRGEVYVCSAGVSPSLGTLVRICPLDIMDKITRWSQVRVDLERSGDSRVETWKLGPARWSTVLEVYPRKARASLLDPYRVDGINEANERVIDPRPGGNRRMSLALVRPGHVELVIEHNPGELAPHRELFGPNPPHARWNGRREDRRERFPFTVRARWVDPDGRRNNLQVRDWGLFELLRKQAGVLDAMTDGERTSYIAGALHINERSLFLVGNFDNHRTSWLVISVLNGCLHAHETDTPSGQISLPL